MDRLAGAVLTHKVLPFLSTSNGNKELDEWALRFCEYRKQYLKVRPFHYSFTQIFPEFVRHQQDEMIPYSVYCKLKESIEEYGKLYTEHEQHLYDMNGNEEKKRKRQELKEDEQEEGKVEDQGIESTCIATCNACGINLYPTDSIVAIYGQGLLPTSYCKPCGRNQR